MALIAAVQGAITLGSSVLSLFSPKDQERKAATDQAYNLAVAGDQNALLFLKQRTGNYGTVQVPGYGLVGGWATDPAKQYASQRYQAALNELSLMGQVEKVGEQASGFIKTTAREAGYEILPQWAVWGAVAVVAFLILSKRSA